VTPPRTYGENVLNEPVQTPPGGGQQRFASGEIEVANPQHAENPSMHDPKMVVSQNPSRLRLFEDAQFSMGDRAQPGLRWGVTDDGDLYTWESRLATHLDMRGELDIGQFAAQGEINGAAPALREQQVQNALNEARRVRNGQPANPNNVMTPDDVPEAPIPGPLNPGDRNLPEMPGRGPIRPTLDTGRWNAQGLWDDGENLRQRHPITGLTYEQTQARSAATSQEPWTDYYPAREPMGEVPPAVMDDVVPPRAEKPIHQLTSAAPASTSITIGKRGAMR
jgi:hypothetical protein